MESNQPHFQPVPLWTAGRLAGTSYRKEICFIFREPIRCTTKFYSTWGANGCPCEGPPMANEAASPLPPPSKRSIWLVTEALRAAMHWIPKPQQDPLRLQPLRPVGRKRETDVARQPQKIGECKVAQHRQRAKQEVWVIVAVDIFSEFMKQGFTRHAMIRSISHPDQRCKS